MDSENQFISNPSFEQKNTRSIMYGKIIFLAIC